MKKITLLVLFVSMLGFALNSCKKSDGSAVGPVSTTAAVTLKVDGTVKTSTSQLATLYTSLNSFQLIAQTGAGEVVNISINNVKVGTFTDALLTYGTDSTFANTYLGTSGSVTITSFTSDTITGTFQFTGLNGSTNKTKVITEGSFSCKYIKV